ncbi:acetoin utilization deacetylase AcuC-like enzyme [Collimonas sp. PA-H2]|uniref:histone deacetylase family protein n=1 Tax=Collimonas sp. PA-H2 TaxID=1881062 RepID=UPI000BF31308|nr:histone deacetylase [Collimonas sp. PA-H2]PFH11311.1 acetoin utilization deacetylase AcuC-like enzyme [Collimonas sp. PA-H2]
MKAFYSDHFVLPLPAGHRFPMQKYRLIHEGALATIAGIDFHEAPSTSDGVLALAHHPRYIAEVSSGTLADSVQKAIGFPWTPQMVERSRRSAGATIAACRAALAGPEPVAVNLAGGTHHAFADQGAGFCVFNDAAIAARLMQAERRVQRVVIVDLDVHQGNGTASILARDDSIFTLSLHGAHNYPFSKEQSDLDVALEDGTGDEAYLDALQGALATMLARFSPQLIIFLAGADPHEGDRLGRLKLSFDGLARRDAMVLETAGRLSIPVAISMAGGYGKNIQDTVAVHLQTIALAASFAKDLALRHPAAAPLTQPG